MIVTTYLPAEVGGMEKWKNYIKTQKQRAIKLLE
jgi:hypothetical protein